MRGARSGRWWPRERPSGRPLKRRSRRSRLVDLLLTLVVLGAVALAGAYAPFLREAEVLRGTARVADGDSLVLDGERIRLQGIDAPELTQTCTRVGADYPCGREAREALARLVAGRSVSCESRQRDRYERVLATCVAGGVEVNRAMVEAGWAVAYGDYSEAEAAAREARRGLWAGAFERPQDWRRIHGGPDGESHDWLSPLVGWLRRLFGL